MKEKKLDEISFPATGKETFKDRLKQLIGERSVRAAAKDWGLSVSTLNNYLNRGTEPTLGVINTIAHVEQTSIDWLANGVEPAKAATHKYEEHDNHQLRQAWLMVFDALEPSEANALLKTIHRNGVIGVLKRTQQSMLTSQSENVEQLIDSLPIRDTLKQAIKVALGGDEVMDREILRRFKFEQNTAVPSIEASSVDAGKKAVG